MKKPAARHTTRALLAAAGALAAIAVAGCARPLLSPEETRSPFDSYDSVRGQYAPQKIFDDVGREKPNLQQRLSSKD